MTKKLVEERVVFTKANWIGGLLGLGFGYWIFFYVFRWDFFPAVIAAILAYFFSVGILGSKNPKVYKEVDDADHLTELLPVQIEDSMSEKLLYKYCKNCGAKIDADSLFCAKCGAAQSAEEKVKNAAVNKTEPKLQGQIASVAKSLPVENKTTAKKQADKPNNSLAHKKIFFVVSLLIVLFFVLLSSRPETQKQQTNHTMKPFVDGVDIALRTNTDNRTLYFSGTTNLPDGMELMASIIRKDKHYLAQDNIVVNNGTFKSAVFTNKGDKLNPGSYIITLQSPSIMIQNQAVQNILGNKGLYLKGPYVVHSDAWKENIVFFQMYVDIT